jgi:hypothetical protein
VFRFHFTIMSVDRCQLSVAELETRYDRIQWYGEDRV